MKLFLIALAVLAALPFGSPAQEMTALARVEPASSVVRETGTALELELRLSQPVPFRVFTLTDPMRVVLDFSEVDWTGLDPAALTAVGPLVEVAMGRLRPGWSRLVLELASPYGVSVAEMNTGDGQRARMRLRLDRVTADDFAAQAGAPASALFRLPQPVVGLTPPKERQRGDRPVVVVLDPGHGGIDPGAEHNDTIESHLMLLFARELRDVLVRAGGFKVVLTRDDDIFVPLESRQSIARAAGADLFLSLHADALAEGRAHGATIYTLSDTASDLASSNLAERHDRADLLAGLDLSNQDDVIATVLMDLARTETAPRSDRLAQALVTGMTASIGEMHKRPRLSASFSVLKAPDIPSALIELGFLSSPRDVENLRSEDWRARAAIGIRDALQIWARGDAAEAALIRR